MSDLKTKANSKNVEAFLDSVKDENKKADSYEILKIMEKITGEKPMMWGSSIIGFGKYHYKYASGREGDWFRVGFSPRKQNISIYLTCDLDEHKDSLKKLGKHKRGRGCLYVNKLEDVDLSVLKKMIKEGYKLPSHEV